MNDVEAATVSTMSEALGGPSPDDAVRSSSDAGDTGSTIVISPMRRRDIRSVLQIDGLVHPRPWTAGMYLGELANKGTRTYVVARSGHRVVGFCGVMLMLDEGHVTTVAVHPDWHRRSIATQMLLVACRRGVAMGATALTLEVRMANKGAQELYRRFGFAPAGVRKNYYPESNEDALVMWATGAAETEYRDRLARIEADLAVPLRVQGFLEQADEAGDA